MPVTNEQSNGSETNSGMPRWWLRLLYSFASMIAAIVITLEALTLSAPLGAPKTWESVHSGAVSIFIFLIFAFPGWLLGIPVVLKVENIRGWRFWTLLSLGACIGPLVLIAYAVCAYLADKSVSKGIDSSSWRFIGIGAMVSALTTLIYLCILKNIQRPETATPQNDAPGG